MAAQFVGKHVPNPVNPIDPIDPTGDGRSYLERMTRGLGNNDPDLAKDFAEKLKRFVEEGKDIRAKEAAAKADRSIGVSEYKPRTISGGGTGGGMGTGKMNRDITKNYKKGGNVSTASKRADGCCIKGKTKGRMV